MSTQNSIVESVTLKISQVESEKDFYDFLDDFTVKFEEKFGKGVQISMQNKKPIFSLDLDDFGEIRIDYMEKKKEKLIKLENWAYYLPAGWICYQIDWKAKKSQQISSYV